MYELTVERTFAAAHCLRQYDGPCARLHGHNYRIQFTVQGQSLDGAGMLMDFGELKGICDTAVDELDHRCLNDLEPFASTNPTSENLARHLFERVAEQLADRPISLTSVTVYESDTSRACYRPG
jgi:6-pyruvoyltetrahydropterin/6-carboxytetrahydropterin synthase